MKKYFVVDAGPIVGSIDRTDQWNKTATTLFKLLPMPLLTCEAVISECFFLLGESSRALEALFGLFATGVLSIEFSLGNEAANVHGLLQKYHDVPMSLADGCLVRMSEIFDAPVFTFDTDFRIYRRNRRSIIPLIGIDN